MYIISRARNCNLLFSVETLSNVQKTTFSRLGTPQMHIFCIFHSKMHISKCIFDINSAYFCIFRVLRSIFRKKILSQIPKMVTKSASLMSNRLMFEEILHSFIAYCPPNIMRKNEKTSQVFKVFLCNYLVHISGFYAFFIYVYISRFYAYLGFFNVYFAVF